MAKPVARKFAKPMRLTVEQREELKALERRRREYAKKKREEWRRIERESERQYRADLKAGRTPPRPELDPRHAARSAARIERRVRRLVERGLRALASGRWDDAGGYFIDAAAVLDDQSGPITSHEGYELISAEDSDALFEVATVVMDEKGRARAVLWEDIDGDEDEAA